MKKLRVALLLFLIALSLPLSYVLLRTYSGLRQEEVSRLRFFATALFDAMEVELAELILREEGRPVDAYGSADAVSSAADLAPPDQDALNDIPAEAWLRGYLQNQPDGGFQTPLATGDTHTRERRRELAAFNTRFNAIRYQAPQPVWSPKSPALAPLEKGNSKEKRVSETLWYQSSPSKARSSMERQKVRVEEITATQARKVTRPTPKNAASP